MNTKVEPALAEKENHSLAPKNNSIEKFLEIVTKQTKLNNEIISALSLKDISKENKLEMLQMLSEGAQKSSFFMKVMKNKEKYISLEINESIPEKTNIKDKFSSFKNMLISFQAKIDPSIIFRNPSKPDWYEVGHKVGAFINSAANTTQSTHNTLVKFFKQTAENLGLAVKEVKIKRNLLESQFYLIGEKRNVKILEKKFSKVFDLLGVEAKEMLHSSDIRENISEEDLVKKISEKLNKEMSIDKDPSSDKFTFSILNGLTPDLQIAMLKDLIWPKVKNAIQESMEVNLNFQNSKNENRYLQIVSEFSKENNFSPDLVIHSLKNNPDLLIGYPKFEKLINNKNKIIENADKYGKFILNNFVYLESLVKASEDMKNLTKGFNVSPDLKVELEKTINNTVIFSQEGKNITFEQLKENLLSVTPEEKKYNPQVKN